MHTETMAIAQINLGQFSLAPTPYGGWNMGMSQGLNILGFGGHRALGIAGNNGGVGLSGTDSAIVANERVGVDSGLSAGGRGVNLGSQVQFGNNPRPMHPGGQFGNFLDSIRNFFAGLIPAPLPLLPAPAPPPVGLPGWQSGVVSPAGPRRVSTEGGVGPDGFLPRPWETDEKPGPVDGDSTLSRKHGWTSEEFKPIGGDSSPSGQESAEETFPTLVPTSLETLKSFETSEDSDPFDKPTDKPRQLPGMVGMSDPS